MLWQRKVYFYSFYFSTTCKVFRFFGNFYTEKLLSSCSYLSVLVAYRRKNRFMSFTVSLLYCKVTCTMIILDYIRLSSTVESVKI